MPLLQWTPDLSVSVQSLDTDHKIIITLINQLSDAIQGGEPKNTVSQVLDALLDYTDYHFTREEALMAACGYPDLDAHKRTHATMRAQVRDIRERYHRNAESIHAREVLAFLRNWLQTHIVGRDHLYVPYMQQQASVVNNADDAFRQAPQPRAAGSLVTDSVAPAHA